MRVMLTASSSDNLSTIQNLPPVTLSRKIDMNASISISGSYAGAPLWQVYYLQQYRFCNFRLDFTYIHDRLRPVLPLFQDTQGISRWQLIDPSDIDFTSAKGHAPKRGIPSREQTHHLLTPIHHPNREENNDARWTIFKCKHE